MDSFGANGHHPLGAAAVFNQAGGGEALRLHALSNKDRITQTCESGFPACRQVNCRGRSSREEAERVPDNYPHRPPPLSGRREDTQSKT